MQRLEVAAHEAGLRQRHGERRVGAGVAQVHETLDGDGVVLDALVEQLLGGRAAELVGEAFEFAHGRVVQRRLDRSLAARPLLRQAHAVGRQKSRQRVHEHRLDAERVGDQAGVLPSRGAEAVERVFGDVVAALDGDLLDGVGHVLDGDADAAVGNLLRRAPVADVAGEIDEGGAHGVRIEGLIVCGAEDLGEEPRIELAEHDVGVGDGQRAAAAIGLWARVGAGAVGTDAEARARRRR